MLYYCWWAAIFLVCDLAGPGFDKVQINSDPRTAAQYSQCIHTNSKARGTEERNCDQNWLMGHCGEAQPASGYTLLPFVSILLA